MAIQAPVLVVMPEGDEDAIMERLRRRARRHPAVDGVTDVRVADAKRPSPPRRG